MDACFNKFIIVKKILILKRQQNRLWSADHCIQTHFFGVENWMDTGQQHAVESHSGMSDVVCDFMEVMKEFVIAPVWGLLIEFNNNSLVVHVIERIQFVFDDGEITCFNEREMFDHDGYLGGGLLHVENKFDCSHIFR